MSRPDRNSVLLGCLAVMAAGVAGTAIRGLVLAKIWLWFAVPIFQAPELGAARALGLSMLIHRLSPQPRKSTDEDFLDSAVATVGYCLGEPLILLAFAWIVRMFL